MVLFCIVGLALLSICAGSLDPRAPETTCPPGGGFVCYPNDCSNQFQQCVDYIFYPPEPTPNGLLCKGNSLVFPSSCSLTDCPQPSCSLSQILSERDYMRLFPYWNGGANNAVANQQPVFNYSKLISAANRFPSFACTGSAEDRRRELAAFLAQTSQETSGWWAGQPYNWGYYFSTEIGCTNEACEYCDPTVHNYPCVPGVGYFGRGPIQLSWNYNYGQFSEAIYGNKDILLNDPDLIFEGDTAFLSALWFWMTPQDPKPSCHDVITGRWSPSQDDIDAGRVPGFGMVTNIVNGAIECSVPTLQTTENRVQYFLEYLRQFGIPPANNNLYCENMQHY